MGCLRHTAGTCRGSQNLASLCGQLPNSSNQMGGPLRVEGEVPGSPGPTPAAGTLLSAWGPESRGPAALGGERTFLQAWLPEQVAGLTRLF